MKQKYFKYLKPALCYPEVLTRVNEWNREYPDIVRRCYMTWDRRWS